MEIDRREHEESLNEYCGEDLCNAILAWHENNPSNFKPNHVYKIRESLIQNKGISSSEKSALINIIIGFKIDVERWMESF